MQIPASPARNPQAKASRYALVAALLSYLVPGLGQISQGRVAKGLLFMVCLYGLFFYGMALGDWSNVYLPETEYLKEQHAWNLPQPVWDVYNRLQFAGQFWMGIVVWPAIWQYNHMPMPSEQTSPFWHNFERMPPESRDLAPPGWTGKTINETQTDSDKRFDLGWVYTVIAGVLNILVIYDALAGPAFVTVTEPGDRRGLVPAPRPS